MIQVEAGQPFKGSIELVNDKDFPVEVSISIDNNQTQAAAEWLKFNQAVLQIEPKGRQQLEYEVFIPKGNQGEFSNRISFLEEKVGLSKGTVAINTKVSVPFFALVKETEVYDLQIVSFEMDEGSSKEATVKLQNKGNLHSRPKGTCAIKSLTNPNQVQSIDVNKTGYPVYPGSEKAFKLSFEALPPGNYLAEIQLVSSTHQRYSTKKSFEFEITKAL